MAQQEHSRPTTLFYSYAHADEALREQLEQHLQLLEDQGLLLSWHDRQIEEGSDWQHALNEHLEHASIILLLISPDFLTSNYCRKEMQRALERQQAGEARVIPLILRPCEWQKAPFGHLQALPRDGKPVTSWPNQDEAFLQVSRSLHELLTKQPLSVNGNTHDAMQTGSSLIISPIWSSRAPAIPSIFPHLRLWKLLLRIRLQTTRHKYAIARHQH